MATSNPELGERSEILSFYSTLVSLDFQQILCFQMHLPHRAAWSPPRQTGGECRVAVWEEAGLREQGDLQARSLWSRGGKEDVSPRAAMLGEYSH